MDRLCRSDLGSKALDHMRATLQEGGPISSALESLERGSVWAYLPCTPIQLDAEAYKSGNVFSAEDATEMHQQIVLFIRDFLQSSKSNVALFEDQFFDIDDPPNSTDQQLFKYRGTVYHYRTCDGVGSTSEIVDGAIHAASHYPQVIILTTIPTRQALPSRGEITEDIASDLIRKARHVIIGAFDEEGYIVWSGDEN